MPGTATAPSQLGPLGDEYYTSDDKPTLLTDVDHIGPWIARIIGDPRTANQYVVVWEDELTLRESREIAEAASGEAATIASSASRGAGSMEDSGARTAVTATGVGAPSSLITVTTASPVRSEGITSTRS